MSASARQSRIQGGTVVPVFGVAVVFNDAPMTPFCPIEKLCPSLGGEDRAARILVSGSDQYSGRPDPRTTIDLHPVRIHRHAPRLQARGLYVRAPIGMSGILDSERPDATVLQDATDEPDALHRRRWSKIVLPRFRFTCPRGTLLHSIQLR